MLTVGELGPGAGWAFNDRRGGASRAPYAGFNLSLGVGDDPDVVATNRASVARELDAGPVVWLHAQHGRNVALVSPDDAGQGAAELLVDGLVTTHRGLVLGVLAADCAMVLLADPTAGVVAALHCGRPGLLAGIVDAVVAKMHEVGARTVSAVLGPTVCAGCYEVPGSMRDELAASVPAAFGTSRHGTPAVDLPGAVAAQLAAAGVRSVTRHRACTVEDASQFSYRRDGRTGRHGGFVWLAP